MTKNDLLYFSQNKNISKKNLVTYISLGKDNISKSDFFISLSLD
jgi:hypothetical protein